MEEGCWDDIYAGEEGRGEERRGGERRKLEAISKMGVLNTRHVIFVTLCSSQFQGSHI